MDGQKTKRSGVPLFRCLNHPCRNKVWSMSAITCMRPACQSFALALSADTLQAYTDKYTKAMRDYNAAIMEAERMKSHARKTFHDTQCRLARAFIVESR